MDQSSPDFFPATREESLSIKFLSDLDIWSCFSDIRVQNRKLPEIAKFWTFYLPSQILVDRSSTSYTRVMTPASRHVIWKMFCEDTPTIPKVKVANTLNFKPKLSRLKFLLGTPSQFGCTLSRLGQSLARVKISGRSTP